jgi:hypothetical protein
MENDMKSWVSTLFALAATGIVALAQAHEYKAGWRSTTRGRVPPLPVSRTARRTSRSITTALPMY